MMKIVAWRFRPVNARGMPWVFSYYEPPVPEGSFICEPLCVSNDVEKMRAHNERMHRALEYMLRNGELQYDLESLARHALANEDYPLGPKNSARAKPSTNWPAIEPKTKISVLRVTSQNSGCRTTAT